MIESVRVKIHTNTKFHPLRAALTAALQIGVISVGVIVESEAMQWIGFLALLFLFLVMPLVIINQDRGLTIAEARQKLDELEGAAK